MLLLSGCGGESPYYKTGKLVPVAGKVTLDGQPLSKGIVYFAPATGVLKLSPVGTIDSTGTYQLTTAGNKGAPLGQFKAFVDPAFDEKVEKGERPAIDPKFLSANSSPLTIEVVENAPAGAYDLTLTK